MPHLIIQTNEDGTVLIAAPQQIPPELMEGAESAESLEQAIQIAQEVLGAENTGGDQPADPNSMGGEASSSQQAAGAGDQGIPPQGGEALAETQPEREDEMAQGWSRAKKGH